VRLNLELLPRNPHGHERALKEEEGIGRERNMKCPIYADDLTLTLLGSHSVSVAFEIIDHFDNASGLKLNKLITQSLVTNTKIEYKNLPSINWNNQHISILGTIIGSATTKIR